MLHKLPPELVISVLAYLPLSSLQNVRRTSKHLENLIRINESIIYRNAAACAGFIASTNIAYADLGKLFSRSSLGGSTDWKSFCATQQRIRASWAGDAPSRVRSHPSAGKYVHRIKVDDLRGLIIVTSSRGGLRVIDLHDDEILWSLPTSYVHRYAHCEYDDGFLIFDRGGLGSEKEVWRLEDSIPKDGPQQSTMSPPDQRQLDACVRTVSGLTGTNGVFRPWSLLKPTELTRAFRFVYPTLAAASESAIYLWNIPTGELIQTIQDTQTSNTAEGFGSESLGDVNYVEVSPSHVLLCGSYVLRVFSRSTGRAVLDILSEKVSYGEHMFIPDIHARAVDYDLVSGITRLYPFPVKPVVAPENDHRLIDEFIAVHVSTCGSHIVGLLASSRLIIIPFFARAVAGVDVWDLALDVQLGSLVGVSKYLAVEQNHIVVATGTGLFVITLDWNQFQSEDIDPIINVQRAMWFNNPIPLNSVSCLQVTPTGAYLNWDRSDQLTRAVECEIIFYSGLSEERSVIDLANGDKLIQLFEPAHQSVVSNVVSIDFTPSIPL